MKKLLNKGDVILTNPIPGFWGIAVVLTERDKTSEFDPMCHIAVTPLVFQKEVSFTEINIEKLIPLEIEGWNFNPMSSNKDLNKVIGVYSRVLTSPVNIIGSIDPAVVYAGPLPWSPDYGLEVTWPLCGNVDKQLGYQSVIAWRKVHDVASLEAEINSSKAGIIENSNFFDEEDEVENELWVMIKMDQYFLSQKEIDIEEEIIDLMEEKGLGEADGHSSGASQFDFNFVDVTDYERAKKEITKYINKLYPNLKFVISKTYETTFDNK